MEHKKVKDNSMYQSLNLALPITLLIADIGKAYWTRIEQREVAIMDVIADEGEGGGHFQGQLKIMIFFSYSWLKFPI